MTSCDLSVLGEMIHETDCSCFRDIMSQSSDANHVFV